MPQGQLGWRRVDLYVSFWNTAAYPTFWTTSIYCSGHSAGLAEGYSMFHITETVAANFNWLCKKPNGYC